MKRNSEKSAPVRRRFIWRGLTVLLFFYLCADVTVLEYFCGNPSLGIASYKQIVEINPQPAKASETNSTRNAIDDLRSSKQEPEPDIPFDGDDCFCCSSHAVITYNHLIVSLVPIIRPRYDAVFSVRPNYSSRYLPSFYRPPRSV